MYNISTLNTTFSSKVFLEFEYTIYNEEYLTSPDIEEMPTVVQERNRSIETLNNEKIIEILYKESNSRYVIFRTSRQVYIYKIFDEMLIKCLINKPLLFINESRSLYDINGLLYCRARHPCILVLENNVYAYETSIKLIFPAIHNNWIFAISKGHLLKCKLIDLNNLVLLKTLLLGKLELWSYNLLKLSIKMWMLMILVSPLLRTIEKIPLLSTLFL